MNLKKLRSRSKDLLPKNYFVKKILNKIKSYFYVHGFNTNCENLVERHFKFWSDESHPNYNAFSRVVNILGGGPAVIVETGTSAWGTDSTRLWDFYVRAFGGELWTVDIRPDAGLRLKGQISNRTKVIVQDSVDFLSARDFGNADLYYLDSWDVDWSDSYPSALHGKNEFEAIKPLLRTGDLILIDDTPADIDLLPAEYREAWQRYISTWNAMPGKGGLVVAEIAKDQRYEILFHEYAVLIKYTDLQDDND